MRANRLVLAAMTVGAAAGPAFGQRPVSPSSNFGSHIVPVQATTPASQGKPIGAKPMVPSGSTPASASGGMTPPVVIPQTSPMALPTTSGTNPLGMPTMPAPSTPGTANQPLETLTAPPGAGQTYPPGTVFSPLTTDSSFPLSLGRNGPVGSEPYFQTGPSILAGRSTIADAAKSGWLVGGGYRTLWWNTTQDAAWTFNIGVSYIRNDGDRFDKPPVLVTASEIKNGLSNDQSLVALGIRGISRTSFDFGVGRDWWLGGPGATGGNNPPSNWRFGGDVGGRWGTASIDFAPTLDPEGFRHRRSTLHGVYAGGHIGWERPFGNFIAFTNFRTEWSYTWTNLIPPNESDFVDVNLLFSAGIRF